MEPFGIELCTEKNGMLVEEFMKKKDVSSSSLFKVPQRYKFGFESVLKNMGVGGNNPGS